jgi:hypothetical protein
MARLKVGKYVFAKESKVAVTEDASSGAWRTKVKHASRFFLGLFLALFFLPGHATHVILSIPRSLAHTSVFCSPTLQTRDQLSFENDIRLE